MKITFFFVLVTWLSFAAATLCLGFEITSPAEEVIFRAYNGRTFTVTAQCDDGGCSRVRYQLVHERTVIRTGSSTAGPNFNCDFDMGSSLSGRFELSAVGYNSSGSRIGTDIVIFFIDRNQPNLARITPTSATGDCVRDPVLINADVTDDGEKIHCLYFWLDGNIGTSRRVVVDSSVTSGSASFSIPVGSPGRHTISIVVEDTCSRRSVARTSDPMTIDTDGPTLTNVIPTDGTVYSVGNTLRSSAIVRDSGCGIRSVRFYLDNDGELGLELTPVRSMAPPLAPTYFTFVRGENLRDGDTHQIIIVATDYAGNRTRVVREIQPPR